MSSGWKKKILPKNLRAALERYDSGVYRRKAS